MKTTELQPGIVKVTVGPKEVKVFRDLSQDLLPKLDSMTEPDFLDEMQRRAPEARRRLPKLAGQLRRMRDHNGPKVMIVDFPESTVANVPPTPIKHLNQGDTNLFEPDIYRGLVVAMNDWYGYGYTSQQDGLIHNNIVQVKELESVAGHSGSAPHELGLHTEDASYNLGEGHDISPDFLTLHYFRNPSEVPTLVAIPEWGKLTQTTRDKLREEWFYNRTNPAQGGEGNNPAKPVSVVYGPQGDPWIRLNTAKLDLESYNPEERAAVEEIRDQLEARRIDLDVKAGQIAIIDNRRVLHGRPAFKPGQEPHYDGTDRWQRRLVVSNDASRIQAHETRRRVVNPESVISA